MRHQGLTLFRALRGVYRPRRFSATLVLALLVFQFAGAERPKPPGTAETALGEVPTVQEILERSLAASERNRELAANYTWRETRIFRKKDSLGAVNSQESETVDVMVIGGRKYSRLVMIDGQPLSPERERKEQRKLDSEVAKHRSETAANRESREARQEKKRRDEERLYRAIPKAFRFEFLGEEIVQGRPAWAVRATPLEGFRPSSRETGWLPKLKGTLWIDRRTSIWLKAELETLDTISFGWVLARLGKGTRMQFEQQLINGEIWMPRRTAVDFGVRLALFKTLHGEAENLYSDYRKFSADSRMVSAGEVDP